MSSMQFVIKIFWYFGIFLICLLIAVLLFYPRVFYSWSERNFEHHLVEKLVAGQTNISLLELIDFDWQIACYAVPYIPTPENKDFQKHLGDNWWELLPQPNNEDIFYIYFKLASGQLNAVQVRWQHFTKEFQQNSWAGWWYSWVLNNQGYSITLETPEQSYCFLPSSQTYLVATKQ